LFLRPSRFASGPAGTAWKINGGGDDGDADDASVRLTRAAAQIACNVGDMNRI
jgi:hypothetical protein